MARRRFRRPRTGLPYQTGQVFPKPPPQFYDPQFDQQERASGRGFGDLRQDIARSAGRNLSDYLLNRGNIIRTGNQNVQDLATRQQRQNQDYQRTVGSLDRGYQQRAQVQTQQATGALGDTGGGALAQALQKRAQSYKLARQPIDVAQQRGTQDIQTQTVRNAQNVKQSLGRLGLGYQRGVENQTTQLARAGRENRFFKTDTAESRFRAAQAAGWTGFGKAPHGARTRYGVSYMASPHHPGYFKLASGRYVTRGELGRLLRRGKRSQVKQRQLEANA